MSRLIIKNLPRHTTPAHLRTHFSQSSGPGGTITDVKVALKPDGTSRRFGFVGYKTEKEAEAAKNWFDGTFLGEAKMQVGVVDGMKDAPTPRPNKRRKLGPSLTDELPIADASSKAKKGGDTIATRKGKDDAQFDQFRKVMQSNSKKGPSWANEPQAPPPIMQEEIEEAGRDEGVGEEGISDLDWMKKHMTKNVENLDGDVENVVVQSDNEHAGANSKDEDEQPPKDPTKETILQTSRLFLRNLAFSCTDADLLELFTPFGEVSQVHIPLDPQSKQSKGMAYVTFSKPTCAVTAYETLDKRSFQGRLLHILPAVDRKGKFQVEEGEGKKKSLKDERNSKRKATAGREFNWSMLYMNSDAVASSIADRMSIPKSVILNPEGSDENAAVKLALAETHIINETKTYLESQGVILSAFSSSSNSSSSRIRRSDTVILVKNIPYGTSIEDIKGMFEAYGDLERVLVPPAGTMAVVEFKHADEAGKAFKGVAYRRLGSSVVYLEKGPVGMFESHVSGDEGGSGNATTASGFKPITIAEQEGAQEEEPGLAEGSTLFVKNLSFSTTSDRLSQVFKGIPTFSFARVQTKPDPKKPGGILSMGYGFVGFKTVDGAKKAMKSLQGFVLDGHALHVKFAGRGREEDVSKDKAVSKSRTTKMIVKNVPFEATKKDIRDLFSAHGHLKSVRLPKKFDTRSRGFAFLEFVTRHEAENAYAALRHTHLLGRHLVLEWAEEAEQDLDVLRKKAGVGFGGGAEMPGKKRKLQLGDGGGDADDDVE